MGYTVHIRSTNGKKLYIDPGFTKGVYLYPGEIAKEQINDGDPVTEEDMGRLRMKYAIPRARKRALGILAKRDCTEKELRDKLKKSVNDELSIENAINHMRSCGYVDDKKYAEDYLYFKREKKSYRRIRMELEQKGISDRIIDHVFEEAGDQEMTDILPLVTKYVKRFSDMDTAAKQKTCMYFYRKGYSAELIRKAMEELGIQ